MANCEKCVFSKCCQDSGSNPKSCVYYEEDRKQIVLYRINNNLGSNGETKLTDEMIAETLIVMQKDHVKEAKSQLALMLSTVFLVMLLVASFVAVLADDTNPWARIFMQCLVAIVGVCIAVVVLYAIYACAKYVFDNAKIVARGR